MMTISRCKMLLKVYDCNVGKMLRNFCSKEDLQVTMKNENYTFSGDENSLQTPVHRRSVPRFINEYNWLKTLSPCQPPNPHLLKVAILGEPNVGKSTLTNRLVKWKVCPVSKKVHTTRARTSAIFVEDNKQVIFLDTPGFVTPEHSIKHHLEVSLVADPESSVREADLIAVIIDAACKWTNRRINENILEILNNFRDKKSVLVLNKVDIQKGENKISKITRTLTRGIIDGTPILPPLVKGPSPRKKEVSLEEIFKKTEEKLKQEKGVDSDINEPIEHCPSSKGWPFFSRVFMVSALQGDGVDDLREYLLDSCKPGEWLYHDSQIIDQSPHEIALATVREKLLDALPQEIPYSLGLTIKEWEMSNHGALIINIEIKCPKERYKQIIMGYRGQRIATCVDKSRQAMQDTFRCEILLKLSVK